MRPRPKGPEVEAEMRPRPRPKFWPRGQFGLEALTSLMFSIKFSYRLHMKRQVIVYFVLTAVVARGFCRPEQRSVVPPLHPATPIFSAVNKLNIKINLR